MRREISVLITFFLVISLCLPLGSGAAWAADLELECEGAILMDAGTGQVLYEKNSNVKWYPASMTKIMTMVLVLEAVRDGRVTLDEKVMASENACSYGGTQVWLEPGEEFTLEEMLKAIAVGSANDCSVAVAEHLAGSEEAFAEQMTQRAKELGAKNTNFVNSHGLHDDNHYTSPYDLAVIARYAVTLPRMLELTSIKEYTFREDPELVLYNTNKLLWWFEGTRGLKTGTTDKAKRNLTAVAERDELRLISVVMGAEGSRGHFTQSMSLLRYGFAKYGYKHFYEPEQQVGTVTVGKGERDTVAVAPKEAVGIIIPKGEDEGIEVKLVLPKLVKAPIDEGQEVGSVKILKDGKEVRSVPLGATESVPRGSLVRQVQKVLLGVFTVK